MAYLPSPLGCLMNNSNLVGPNPKSWLIPAPTCSFSSSFLTIAKDTLLPGVWVKNLDSSLPGFLSFSQLALPLKCIQSMTSYHHHSHHLCCCYLHYCHHFVNNIPASSHVPFSLQTFQLTMVQLNNFLPLQRYKSNTRSVETKHRILNFDFFSWAGDMW